MCIFCKIIAREISSSIVYEDELTLAILDLSQVTKGHTLVMPKKHCANILDCDEATALSVMKTVRKLAIQIKERTSAEGMNILNNNGTIAGQSVEHLHFHLIPRYSDQDSFQCQFKESQKQNLDEVLQLVK